MEGLKSTLGIEVEEDKDIEGKEGNDGTQRALGALEFLTQDAERSGTTLVDARNGFNELSRLEMLWTVRHRWLEGRGSHSIAIGIGRNFSFALRGSRQLQS